MTERPGWDFDYLPVPWPPEGDNPCDVVIATFGAPSERAILSAVLELLPDAQAEILLASPPLFWTRLRSLTHRRRPEIVEALAAARIDVRYVASTKQGSAKLGPSPAFANAPPITNASWPIGQRRLASGHPRYPWFVSDEGLTVERVACGTGLGTRLAVVDDEAEACDRVPLESVVLVGLDRAARGFHGTALIGWAVGANEDSAHGAGPFQGVAPDASARLYCVPKAEVDVVSVPLAIARAVFDGADVVLCATGLEAKASPMLDDALELASRKGRGGRGTIVVMPAGRQASSVGNSVHVSWTMALADPASDPRVTCIGPSGRDGGWFLYADRRGLLRPFANRGPALRWLAPGDDAEHPLFSGRMSHCESSGAAAIAAGVVLLVIGANPRLRACELDAILGRTITPVPAASSRARPADTHDLLPFACDRDGHNAKHGYGRLHAARACSAASDPFAASLIAIGEDPLAQAYLRARKVDPTLSKAYSRRLARWAVRVVLNDRAVDHAVRVIARHVRLALGREDRRRAHGDGALVRQLALLVRALQARTSTPKPTARIAAELAQLAKRATGATDEGGSEDADSDLHAVLHRVFLQFMRSSTRKVDSWHKSRFVETDPTH